MSFLINPYAFLAAGGDFESIATVTVGSGGASSIEFTSIPGSYQHLQIRYIFRSVRAATGDSLDIRFNSTAGASYAYHYLQGDGATATAGGQVSKNEINVNESMPAATALSNAFGPGLIDILDYADASKNSTVRILRGRDLNGSGAVGHESGLWMNTSAISSISLFPRNANFAQHSTAALYGIKAP